MTLSGRTRLLAAVWIGFLAMWSAVFYLLPVHLSASSSDCTPASPLPFAGTGWWILTLFMGVFVGGLLALATDIAASEWDTRRRARTPARERTEE